MPIGTIGTLAGGPAGECEADTCADVQCTINCDDGSFCRCFEGKCIKVVIAGVTAGPYDCGGSDPCVCPGNGTYYGRPIFHNSTYGDTYFCSENPEVYCNAGMCAGDYLYGCEGGVCANIGFTGIGVTALALCGNGIVVCGGGGDFGIFQDGGDDTEGQAAVQAAINALCAGGEVSLPLTAFAGSQGCGGIPSHDPYPEGDCDYSSATCTISLIEGPCPDTPDPPPPPDPPSCDGLNECESEMVFSGSIRGLTESVCVDGGSGITTTYTLDNFNGALFLLYTPDAVTCAGTSGGGNFYFIDDSLGTVEDFDNAGVVVQYFEGPGDARRVVCAYAEAVRVSCTDGLASIEEWILCTQAFNYTEGDPGSIVFEGVSTYGSSTVVSQVKTAVPASVDGSCSTGESNMSTVFSINGCDDVPIEFTITGRGLGGPIA